MNKDCCNCLCQPGAENVNFLISIGRLKNSSPGAICNARVPLTTEAALGQDVGCVGKAKKGCPGFVAFDENNHRGSEHFPQNS